MSASTSSRFSTSTSRRASAGSSNISALSKQRTTWTRASVCRTAARYLFPEPSPRARPAISTNSMVAGVTLSGLWSSASQSSRLSGTFTVPRLGLSSKERYMAVSAFSPVMALKRVLFPTFGNPTIPSFMCQASILRRLREYTTGPGLRQARSFTGSCYPVLTSA